MKVDINTIDYYTRARGQGASAYVARTFEIYAFSAIDEGGKPMTCKRFLDEIDWTADIESIVTDHHGVTAAARIWGRMRRMAAPGTI